MHLAINAYISSCSCFCITTITNIYTSQISHSVLLHPCQPSIPPRDSLRPQIINTHILAEQIPQARARTRSRTISRLAFNSVPPAVWSSVYTLRTSCCRRDRSARGGAWILLAISMRTQPGRAMTITRLSGVRHRRRWTTRCFSCLGDLSKRLSVR